VLIAGAVGFCAAAATFAVSSNVFEGGTDSGNQIAATAVGLVVGLALIAFFGRRGIAPVRALAVIVATWALGFVLLFAVFLAFMYIGCSGDGGCR
jgi:hypothetical protein